MSSRQYFQKWALRFWEIAGSVSIRTKIIGIILGLVILLGGGLALFVRQSLHGAMSRELETLAVSVTHDLANRSTDLILVNNVYALYELVQETQHSYPDIRYILILDTNNQALVHTFGSGLPGGLIEANLLSTEERYNVFAFNTAEGKVLDVAMPIFGGRAGVARVGFSDLSIQRTVNLVTTQLLLATLLVSTIGIVASIFLTWILTRPILSLAGAAQAVGQGNFDQHVVHWANDEIGELSDAFNTMVADLSRASDERRERDRLRTEMVEKVISAQEEERKRIARDLHDQTSQALISLIVQLKLVESASNKNVRTQAIADLREQLRSTLNDVRRMAHDLRPGVLDDLGLTQSIQWFADQCRRNTDINISLTVDAACDHLPPHAATAVYRVTQEALSNVMKHSQATQVGVTIKNVSNGFYLEVRDNGIGFDASRLPGPGEGLGLFGMQERIQLLGGEYSIESAPGQGACLRARVPCSVKESKT
jgi:signal transduction histidine kinase